jgi:hypothetical protein
MIEIRIKIQRVAEEVHLRSYYQGETLKRKDPDDVSVQSGDDDMIVLRPMIETSLSELVSLMMKRVRHVDWEITDEDEMVVSIQAYPRIPHSDEARVAKLMERSMTDYLSLRTLQQWYGTVKPEIRGTVEEELIRAGAAVGKYVSMISGNIRRRSTDLAGI